MLETKVSRYYVIEQLVEGTVYKEVEDKRNQLSKEGYNFPPIDKGYENGEEDKRVFWFNAVKKVVVE